MTAAVTIAQKLTAAFDPTELRVDDESARHAGHAGSPPGGESHFRVRIVASAFAGLSRVERHRRVNAILAHELSGQIHAMALTTLTPDEANSAPVAPGGVTAEKSEAR